MRDPSEMCDLGMQNSDLEYSDCNTKCETIETCKSYLGTGDRQSGVKKIQLSTFANGDDARQVKGTCSLELFESRRH